MPESLPEFIKVSLKQQPPENQQIVFGLVPDAVVERLFTESGIDLTGYVVTIDVYSVIHIVKSHESHGNAEKEEKRGQKAVTVDDFSLIYQIIADPDVAF